MAFPTIEFVGAVIGGLIAGGIGFATTWYSHRLAVNAVKEAARKAKKEAAKSYLVEVEHNQREIKRLLVS